MIIRRFFTALFAFASGWIMIPSMLAGSLIGTAFAVILMGMSFYISPKSYKIRNEQT